MLELENLDLDLDEDFPSDPFNKSNFLVSSQSISKCGQKIKDNFNASDETSNKNFQNLRHEANDLLRETPDLFKENDIFSDIINSNQTNKNIALNLQNKKDAVFSDTYSKQIFNKENNLHLTKELKPAKRILTERKFPGPAGLLPDKPLSGLSDVNIVLDTSFENISSEYQKESVLLCSQTSSVHLEATFKKLAIDFGLNDINSSLSKFTIDWVKKKALKKSLSGKKIPFLAVVLHHLDHSTPDPVVTMRDSTGEIYGTLHREVWSELGEKLHPGAAIALRQVGVLITGVTRRQVYLNVTLNNIVTVYSYADEEEVETNIVNKVTNMDVVTAINNWNVASRNVHQESPLQFFSVIGGSKTNTSSSASLKQNNIDKSFFLNNHSVVNSKDTPQQTVNFMNNSLSTDNVAPNQCINQKIVEEHTTNFNVLLDEDDFNGCSTINQFEGSVKSESRKIFERNNSLFASWMDDSSENILSVGNQTENNRKRKIEGDVNVSRKLTCGVFNKKPWESNQKNERAGRVFVESQHLSQAESQIVEEVLDGIDFDEFDT